MECQPQSKTQHNVIMAYAPGSTSSRPSGFHHGTEASLSPCLFLVSTIKVLLASQMVGYVLASLLSWKVVTHSVVKMPRLFLSINSSYPLCVLGGPLPDSKVVSPTRLDWLTLAVTTGVATIKGGRSVCAGSIWCCSYLCRMGPIPGGSPPQDCLLFSAD